ncbi:MAG: hypothetical protein LC646_00740 [Xanthomonadaceae bacterium]|nr:hypothetical protein [Xanthomonadaceae bacterium]
MEKHITLYSIIIGILAAAWLVPLQALELNVYGVGHISADRVDDGSDDQNHVASNSSRLGVRGSHDPATV